MPLETAANAKAQRRQDAERKELCRIAHQRLQRGPLRLELAGTSTGTTVSVVGVGPLTVGVTYELWVAGHNSDGDGPGSNHVSHTA